MKKVLRFIFVYIPLSFFLLSLSLIVALKWVPVYVTPLMIVRSFQFINKEDFKTVKRWRSLDKISDNMAMAVMASEDTRFLEHRGFDWTEIDNALEASKRGKRLRGAGIYGAEAAARELFGKGAERLTSRESALIAGALPNPLKRRADRPSAYHSSRAESIQRMMGMIARPEWLNDNKSKKVKLKK
jgi:membrane peptidoglycan carboxypeptidase